MTPVKAFGVWWRWDLVILITASWLIGVCCTYQIVHALHVHTMDTHQLLTDVALDMKRSSDGISDNSRHEKEMMDRFEKIEIEQKLLEKEDQERLVKLHEILQRLQKEH